MPSSGSGMVARICAVHTQQDATEHAARNSETCATGGVKVCAYINTEGFSSVSLRRHTGPEVIVHKKKVSTNPPKEAESQRTGYEPQSGFSV